jgi:hypothetical protein
MHLRISVFAAALALLAMTTAAAQKPAAVDARRLVGADASGLMPHGAYDEQRFSRRRLTSDRRHLGGLVDGS